MNEPSRTTPPDIAAIVAHLGERRRDVLVVVPDAAAEHAFWSHVPDVVRRWHHGGALLNGSTVRVWRTTGDVDRLFGLVLDAAYLLAVPDGVARREIVNRLIPRRGDLFLVDEDGTMQPVGLETVG